MLEFWHLPRKTVYSFVGHKYRQVLPKWNKFNERTNTDQQQLLTLICRIRQRTTGGSFLLAGKAVAGLSGDLVSFVTFRKEWPPVKAARYSILVVINP
jgi:hypothetical protein